MQAKFETGKHKKYGQDVEKALENPTGKDSSKGIAKAWVVLGMVLLLYSHNQWVRSLVYCLVDFSVEDTAANEKIYMNLELHFDTTEYGLLASFGFVTLYTVFCLFAGRASDVFDKRVLIVGSGVVWSLATMGQAAAGSFAVVFGCRVLQGASQAYTSPASIALIADYFPSDRRATANAVFSTGLYIGFALASVVIPLDALKGWRFTCLAVGLLGLLCAAAAAAVLFRRTAPGRADGGGGGSDGAELFGDGEDDERDQPVEVLTVGESLRVIAGNRAAVLALLASCLRLCAYYGITVWGPPYWRSAFPAYESSYGVANAFVVCAGGVLASLGGGVLSDALVHMSPRVRAWVPAGGCLLAVPLWTLSVSVDSFYLSIGILFIEYLCAESWFGPFIAILQDELPLNVQGITQGLFGMAFALGNCAPAVMGAVIPAWPLRTVLVVFVGAFYLSAAGLFLAAGAHIRSSQESTLKRRSSSLHM